MGRLDWKGARVSGAVRAAAVRGLQDAGDALIADASNIVPHQEGILQATGDSDVDPGELTMYAWFDGPYAVRQHEDMTLNHPNGRQAKYLETPLNERAAEYLGHVEKAIKKAF